MGDSCQLIESREGEAPMPAVLESQRKMPNSSQASSVSFALTDDSLQYTERTETDVSASVLGHSGVQRLPAGGVDVGVQTEAMASFNVAGMPTRAKRCSPPKLPRTSQLS